MHQQDQFPQHYRLAERSKVQQAISAGDSVSVIGLSGAGKSNFIRSLVAWVNTPACLLVDCNGLQHASPAALFDAMRQHLQADATPQADAWLALQAALKQKLADPAARLCFCFDRFDVFLENPQPGLFNQLRLLRDQFKYRLMYVITTRHGLPAENELAELFFAHTLWLGGLSDADARWSLAHFFQRHNQALPEEATIQKMFTLTGKYPAFLRASAEALLHQAPLELNALLAYTGVQLRLKEFWGDNPTTAELEKSGLQQVALIGATMPVMVNESELTAKERALWHALQNHPGEVMEKDDLIRQVWSEDVIFERGIRDDSLAQLVRRLREKIEPDPSHPRWIITVPGRGYQYQAK